MDYSLKVEYIGDGWYRVIRGTHTYAKLSEDMSDEERLGIKAINAVGMALNMNTREGIVVEIPLGKENYNPR